MDKYLKNQQQIYTNRWKLKSKIFWFIYLLLNLLHPKTSINFLLFFFSSLNLPQQFSILILFLYIKILHFYCLQLYSLLHLKTIWKLYSHPQSTFQYSWKYILNIIINLHLKIMPKYTIILYILIHLLLKSIILTASIDQNPLIQSSKF
jgi:hypothetical protein